MSEKPERVKCRVKSVEEAIILLSKMVGRDNERIDAAGERIEEREGLAHLTAGWAGKSHHSLTRVNFRIASLEAAQVRIEEALARLSKAQADTDQRLDEWK